MKPKVQLRVVGFFLLGAATICLMIAYDRYQNVIEATRKFKDLKILDGAFETLEPKIPTVTYVCSFLGIMFLVAAIQCFLLSIQQGKNEGPFLESDALKS